MFVSTKLISLPEFQPFENVYLGLRYKTWKYINHIQVSNETELSIKLTELSGQNEFFSFEDPI